MLLNNANFNKYILYLLLEIRFFNSILYRRNTNCRSAPYACWFFIRDYPPDQYHFSCCL